MFPLVIVGVAAVAALFLEGCSENRPKEDEQPPKPDPQPQPSPKSFSYPPSLPESPAPTRDPASPSAPPPSASGPESPKKPLSADELRELGEGLKRCLQVQQRYGFSCPPESELPPGCKCQEVEEREIQKIFDPDLPSKFKKQLQKPGTPPATTEASSVSNS
ncbi:MAG: hypothetical protein U1F57_12100 [bacterium]